MSVGPDPAQDVQDATEGAGRIGDSGEARNGAQGTAEGDEDYSDERHALAMLIHDGGCQCRGHTLGWTIRYRDSLQLADAVLAAGYVPRRSEAKPNAYRVEITIPLGLPDDLRDRLFTAVADAVYDWEPKDREGWDAFVSGHAIYDELAEDGRGSVPGGDLGV